MSEKYTLMCKNIPIFDFEYDPHEESIDSIDHVVHPELAPVGACASADTPTKASFEQWIRERVVPDDRFDWDYMQSSEGFGSPIALLFKNSGQSLVDQYWFKEADHDIDWHDINFFENDFENDIDGSGPGCASPGSMFKWWECKDGERKLFKLDDEDERATYAEVAATRLLSRLLDPDEFVPYEIVKTDYGTCSCCPPIVDADMQFVPMRDIVRCYADDTYDGSYEQCRDLLVSLHVPDVEEHLAKMIVCDYLAGNCDRSLTKFGVLRSSDDGRFVKFAPLFSHAHYFFTEVEKENDFVAEVYPYKAKPFCQYPSVQLAFAEVMDWFDPDSLDGFEDELEELLKENTNEPEWFHTAVPDQFLLQFSHVMGEKF